MKNHCVMLCFNQSLNLLLGFYRLSRLAYVFKPSMQNLGSNPTVNSDRKPLNLRHQKAFSTFVSEIAAICKKACQTYKVKPPSRNRRFTRSWFIDTKASDMLTGNGCIDVRPGTSHSSKSPNYLWKTRSLKWPLVLREGWLDKLWVLGGGGAN